MVRILPVLLFFTVILISCTEDSSTTNEEKILVVATTGMIADMVEHIGGDKVQVVSLMGPGVDPHLYKAKQSDLKHMREADMIFYNGLHLEGKMSDVLEKYAQQKPVHAISARIPEELIIHHDGAADPHIWFDVELWSTTGEVVLEVLVTFDPENKELYEKNHQAYKAELVALDRELKKTLADIPDEQRVLITSHDAFSYFGKAYGVQVRGLQGMSTVAEHSIKDVKDMVDFIVGRKIKALFVETSVRSKPLEAVQQGCKDRNWEIVIGGTLYSDAMGDPGTDAGTYTGMIRSNMETIHKALK